MINNVIVRLTNGCILYFLNLSFHYSLASSYFLAIVEEKQNNDETLSQYPAPVLLRMVMNNNFTLRLTKQAFHNVDWEEKDTGFNLKK